MARSFSSILDFLIMSIRRRWKRAVDFELDVRDEGTGGEDGIVIGLEMVGTGMYDVAYTVPVNMPSDNQQFSLQVDTGSSDLWIASTSCSTSSCLQAKGHLYDPNGSTSTNLTFSIEYLSGSASGSIVWDNLSIGGYVVDNQALAAVTDVENEPLADFSGVLGLAPPLDSIISQLIPPATNNAPDGAAWASNLFSLTPTNTAPTSPFLSLALSRPGSNQIPAVFGIGRHPSSIVSNLSLIQYSSPMPDEQGTLNWKVTVRAITVYVNGTARQIQVGRSNSGTSLPSAILDSGSPLILTTMTIANGIYGAIGINPASDGNYYVPCTTPLNMTITLDERPETPLHPLDLTAEPPQDSQSQFCIGLIQTLSNSTSTDMVLGVPFMRNVYTVMAYTTPNPDGSFPPINANSPTGDGDISPHLGLLSLTNATQALEEFNTARAWNQSSGNGTTGGGAGKIENGSTVNLGGRRVSVGIVVLIGVLSFLALCGLLFIIRWFILRRKYRGTADWARDASEMDKVAYMLTRNAPFGDESAFSPGASLTEDELRERRYENYMRERVVSASTMSSDVDGMQVSGYESLGYGYGYGYRYGYSKDDDDELVVKKTQVISESAPQYEGDELWGPKSASMRDSWSPSRLRRQVSSVPLVADQEPQRSTSPPSGMTLPMLQLSAATAHRQSSSLSAPLLPWEETAARRYDPLTPSNSFQPQDRRSTSAIPVLHLGDLGEFGLMSFDDGLGRSQTMAGVGVASRIKIGVGPKVWSGGSGSASESDSLGGRRNFGNFVIPSAGLPSFGQGQGLEGATRVNLLPTMTLAHRQLEHEDLP